MKELNFDTQRCVGAKNMHRTFKTQQQRHEKGCDCQNITIAGVDTSKDRRKFYLKWQ